MRKKHIFIILFIIAILLLVTRITYNMEMNNMSNYPIPGEMVEINQHNIHVYKTGESSKSNSRIILLPGSGTTSPYADFYPLYSKLKDQYEIILYERPGYGWSDKTADDRNIDTMVDELRETLQRVNEAPPYVLVAHSMGALETIRYAQRYPQEIKALVFIDGISPTYAKNFKYTFTKKISWNTIKSIGEIGLINAISKTGVLDKVFIDIDNLPKDLQDIKKFMAIKNMNNSTMENEIQEMSSNGEIILQNGTIGDIQLLLFSATNNGYKNWSQTQTELLGLSTNTKQVVYENTKHYIHHEKAEPMAHEIQIFLEQLD
ncbi:MULTISPECIES: alpha/beta fold hydrolase [unclassified Lysinibacillus]|uniref:alpha/beta fold hydrolase n=1 Tax=unclassified Lysinibacillus TaxID=2636778 RepID=UPI00382ECBCC